MSSKEGTSGKHGDGRPLVPRLRFPEFRTGEEWHLSTLRKFAELKNGYAFKSVTYDSSGTHEIVTISNVQQGFLARDGIRKIATLPDDIQQHQILKRGDILISMTGNVGRVCRVLADGMLMNQRVGKIVPTRIDTDYLYCVIQADKFRETMNLCAAGGAQGNLSTNDILGYVLYFPERLLEQRKIADCLSSLDDLITLETQKLGALKTHKKGLMQQLFPAEGETVPRLRFPEFRDAGEWETKSLIDLAIGGFSNGVFNDPGKVGHGYKLINVLDMYIEIPIDDSALSLVGIGENEFLKNKVEPNDIFFTRSSLVKAGIAQSNIYLGSSEDVTFDGHLIRLRPNKNVIAPMFLYYALKSGSVRSQLIAKGKTATMTTIGQADIAGTKLAIPHFIGEQLKISDCLSSLDDLITAQAQKVEALKTHKKGLLQQLFPTLNEVSA